MKKFMTLLLVACLVFTVVVADTGVPVYGEEASIYRVGYPNETDSLSPFIAYSAYAEDLFKLIYDPLIGIDDDLNIKGKIANDYEVSDDGLTWTFKIKQDIKWSDGEELTVEDIKFSYDLYIKAGLGYSSQFDGIIEINILDDNTVQLVTEKPKANMLQITAPILPKHVWEKIPEEELATFPNKNPIGTGAFIVEEWKEKDSLILKSNKDYFDGTPKIDQLIFQLFANKDTMLQALKTGEIDAALNINPNQVEGLENDPNIEVVLSDERSFTELGFNCWQSENSKGNKLLLDIKIRQAMDYALDKEKLVLFSKMGAASPGTTLLPPSQPEWHYNVPENEFRSYDPEKAKQILEEAGYTDSDGDGIRESKDGDKLIFRFAILSSYDHYVKSSQLMKTMFNEVGIDVEIETMDEGVLIDLMYGGSADFDLFIWGWTSTSDPSYILSVMLTEQIEDMSDCFYSNETYDELYKDQLSAVDLSERKEIVNEMQKIIYEEAPYIIMYYNKSYEAYRTDKFTGFTRVPAKIGPLFYFAQNNTSFINLEPIALETAANVTNETNETSEEPNTTTAPKEEAPTKSNNTALYIILGLVVISIIVVTLRKKSNNK